MDRWASAAEGFLSSDFIENAMETRHDTKEKFDSLDLPTYTRHILTVSNFLDNPQGFLSDLKTPTTWFQIITPKGKHTEHDIGLDKLVNKVSVYGGYPESPLLISEYLPNIYGGNIVVTKAGNIIAEFGEGTNTDYTSRNKTPTHHAVSTPGTKVMRYNFSDPSLRSVIYQAIRPIKRGGEPLPGYYEFIIGDDRGTMRPIFIDARTENPIYQLPDSAIQETHRRILGKTGLR